MATPKSKSETPDPVPGSKIRTNENPEDVSKDPAVVIDAENDPAHPVARAVSTVDVAALNGLSVTENPGPTQAVDASAPVEYEVEGGRKIFLSEGMRHDLLVTGSATDPNTGLKVTRK